MRKISIAASSPESGNCGHRHCRYDGTGGVQLSRNQAGKFVIPNEVSCITGENRL